MIELRLAKGQQVAEYTKVELDNQQKMGILQHAGYCIADANTKADLANNRKKWIRFNSFELTQVIGELSYVFNRCKDDAMFYFLDELISQLEFYEH